jgi:hypothetical protein
MQKQATILALFAMLCMLFASISSVQAADDREEYGTGKNNDYKMGGGERKEGKKERILINKEEKRENEMNRMEWNNNIIVCF